MKKQVRNIEFLNQIREETEKMYGEHSIRAAYNPYVERAHRERSQAVAKVWNGAVVGGARLLHRILADLRRWRERRRTVRALSALGNGALKDIGIGRSEILSVAEEAARLSIPDDGRGASAQRVRTDLDARHPSLLRGGVRVARPIAQSGRSAGTRPTARDGNRRGSGLSPRPFPPIPRPLSQGGVLGGRDDLNPWPSDGQVKQGRML